MYETGLFWLVVFIRSVFRLKLLHSPPPREDTLDIAVATQLLVLLQSDVFTACESSVPDQRS